MITQPANYDPWAAALKVLNETCIKEKLGIDVEVTVTKVEGSEDDA